MLSSLSSLSPLAVAMLLAAASAGCETFSPATCDLTLAGNPFVTYTGGTTTEGPGTDYVYMSSVWGQDLLYLPGGMHYALQTGLPCAPSSIELSLSFGSSLAEDGGGGGLAPSSGNEALILGFDDTEKAIQITSNSCAEFWILVTAGVQGSACPPAP